MELCNKARVSQHFQSSTKFINQEIIEDHLDDESQVNENIEANVQQRSTKKLFIFK